MENRKKNMILVSSRLYQNQGRVLKKRRKKKGRKRKKGKEKRRKKKKVEKEVIEEEQMLGNRFHQRILNSINLTAEN